MDAFLRDGLGLTRNAVDDCLYVRIEGAGTLLIALYVDDLLIACGDIAYLAEIKAALSQRFEMKDLGEAKMCLGLEISRNRKDGDLTLSQAKYIGSVLSRYGMDSAYGAHTPMEAGADLYGANEPADDMPYREAIGSLIYLMVGTRPDIAFALSQLSKFVESPTRTHWNAVTRVLRYVKQTCNHGLCHRSSDSF
jgi:Reverse transcriptase (RNA-dependent DNA polymerase)